MASTVTPFLVYLAHPVYPQRTVMVNALTLDAAETIASEMVQGTRWTVARVIPYIAITQ